MEDLELATQRGQLLRESRDKSEQLVGTSQMMKKRSRKVRATMCMRKWWMYFLAVLIVVLAGLILYFLFRPSD